MQKLGPSARGTLFIQLAGFQSHYLVLVITFDEFRYALISSKLLPESPKSQLVMEDIAWLDVKQIHGDEVVVNIAQPSQDAAPASTPDAHRCEKSCLADYITYEQIISQLGTGDTGLERTLCLLLVSKK
jgi:hypothetical protein